MASYEDIFGKEVARAIRRSSGIPKKGAKKPAPKPGPKAKAKAKAPARNAPATRPKVPAPRPGRPVYGPPVPANVQKRIRDNAPYLSDNDEIEAIIASHTGGTPPPRVAAAWARAGAESARRRAQGQPLDPEFVKLTEQVARYEANKRAGNAAPKVTNPLTGTRLAGFDATRFQGVPGGKSIGGFLQNLGTGAIRFIADAPAAAQLAAEAGLAGVSTATNLATGNSSPTGVGAKRGSGPAGLARGVSKAVEERTRGDLNKAAKGVAEDYRYRWGPLNPVGGEGARVFGERFYNDPLPTILDAGGAYSAVGRAPAAVARGLSVVSKGKTAEALADFGSRSRIAPGEINPVTGKVSEAGGKLHRAPRRIVSQASGETKKGDLRTATNTIEVPRRTYSINIMTRGAQRGADRLRARVVPRIEEAASRRQPAPGQPGTASSHVLKGLTSQAKFDRAQRRGVRNIVFQHEQIAAGTNNREVLPFNRAVRALRPDKNAAGVKVKGLGTEHYATTLHLLDVIAPRAGMTARALRDMVVAKMEETIAKGATQAARAGVAAPRVQVTRRNIAQIRAIPDELLELKDMSNPAVKRVAAAVQAGRELDTISQAKAVRAGIVSGKTAESIKGRAAALLLGGQEWGPALIREMRQAGASRADIATVRQSAIIETPKLQRLRGKAVTAEQALADLTARAPTQGTLGQVYRAGRKVGRADVRLTQAPRLSTRLRRQPVLPRAGETGRAADKAASFTRTQVPGMPLRAPAGEARPKGISAAQGRQFAAKLEGQGKAYEARIGAKGATPGAIKAATRRRDAYLKAVRAEEDRRLSFTPPTRPEMVTGKGVHFPKKPADIMGGGGFGRRKGFAGPPKPGRDTGLLTQRGGFDMNPALLASAAKRATNADVGPISKAALKEFISLGAYRTKTGELASGTRAAQMARTDPTRVVLIHKGRLRQAMSKLDEVEEGKTLEPGDVRFFYGTGKETWLEKLPEGKVSDQYIAVSKAAADVWREAATTVPFLKATDSIMTWWKGGILALSPRWFLNSSIGVASQYGLMAGVDVRSIRQANRLGAVRGSIPSEIVLNNLAHEMGLQAGINPNRVRRVFEAGFRLNDRMESTWRRAGYLNRAKKALRDEGVKVRGLSDAEVAHAIDHMPPSLARNIIRDTDLFLGEFRKFTKFERDVVKRIIPWYSWLRVIARLTFSLPYRSPIRAAALNTLGRAGEAGLSPEDYMRPIYQRGDIVLGNGIRIPTAGLNSPATLQGPLEAGVKIARSPGDTLGIAGEEAAAWVRPELQTLAAGAYGTTPFGGPVFAPGGYGGTVSGYGGAKTLNPASGLPDSTRIRVPFDEALLQAFGGAPVQLARKFAAGGQRPFDTTRTIPMLAAKLSGGDQSGMFLDPAKRPVRQQFWQGLGSTVGVNPVREDPQRLTQKYREAMRDIERQMRRQALKNRMKNR